MALAERINRRTFLKNALAVTAGTILLKSDISNSSEFTPKYSSDELIAKIKDIKRESFSISLHTYEQNHWSAFAKEVNTPKVWGTYYAIEELLYPDGDIHDYIDNFIFNIYKSGATPLISLTTRWPYNSDHPFSAKNRSLMYELLDKVSDRLADFNFPIYLRPFYEMNLPFNKFNVFGANNNLNSKDHEDAFKNIFRHFSKTVKAKRDYETKVFFSPYVNSGFSFLYPFANYFPGNEYCDAVGFDGYFYPNILGNPSPESVFEGPFDEVLELTQGKIPTWIFETGSSVIDHSEWLGHTLLFAMARPECAGFMHFGINRTKEEGIDFTAGAKTIKEYGRWSKLIS